MAKHIWINEITFSSESLKKDVDTTTAALTTSAGLSLERRRRQASVGVKALKFEPEEVAKFCRLVKMYRYFKNDKGAKSPSNIILYHIDPKILLNPLEQISFAFGNKQNWLNNFADNLLNVWKQFIVHGYVFEII